MGNVFHRHDLICSANIYYFYSLGEIPQLCRENTKMYFLNPLQSMGRNRTSVCVIMPASPDSLIFAADSLRRALIFYFPVCSTFFSCISLVRPQTKNWTHGMLIYMFTEVHGLESCLWPTKADLCRDSDSVSRTMAPSFRQGDSDIIDIRSLAGPVGTWYLASN